METLSNSVDGDEGPGASPRHGKAREREQRNDDAQLPPRTRERLVGAEDETAQQERLDRQHAGEGAKNAKGTSEGRA